MKKLTKVVNGKTFKGIEVMRALRKGQASSFYYGQPQGEVCLINRVFGL
ncbi:hypothetical protein ACPS111642_14350 [Acinetobacter pseudolwoffii]|jgi:transposase, IS6 family